MIVITEAEAENARYDLYLRRLQSESAENRPLIIKRFDENSHLDLSAQSTTDTLKIVKEHTDEEVWYDALEYFSPQEKTLVAPSLSDFSDDELLTEVLSRKLTLPHSPTQVEVKQWLLSNCKEKASLHRSSTGEYWIDTPCKTIDTMMFKIRDKEKIVLS